MRTRLILLPALALALAAYFWLTAPPDPARLAATWRIGTGADVAHARNYDEFAPDSPVRLSVTCDEPHHLYVFSHSAEDGTLLLFPSPDVVSDRSNPLPRGRTVLPGRRDGEEIAWTTRKGIVGLTTFVAVASAEPLPELEALATRLRRWSNKVFPDHSMVVTKPATGEDYDGKPRTPLPHALLAAAADLANDRIDPNGPMQRAPGRTEVFLSAWKVRERRQSPPAGK